MVCTKCKLDKELAKGKKICKDCKNSYAKQRKDKLKELNDDEVLNCSRCKLPKGLTPKNRTCDDCKKEIEWLNNNPNLCTKCHQPNELAKGKRICKKCKNINEQINRDKPEIKENRKTQESLYYKQKKEKVLLEPIQIDMSSSKECSTCKQVKTLDNYHLAKCKGTVRAMCKECTANKRKDKAKENIIK